MFFISSGNVSVRSRSISFVNLSSSVASRILLGPRNSIPESEDSTSVCFCWRLKYIVFPPDDSIVSVTFFVSELPSVSIQITEPIPIMIPSIVRIVRILLERKEDNASIIFSKNSTFSTSFPYVNEHSVLKRHHRLTFLCKLR